MPIELKNVSYVYGTGTPFEKKAIDYLSLTIKDDKITGLIGHTGCGKSTVAQLLNGLYKPTSGQVLVDGDDINSSKKLRGENFFRVGLVFQYPEYQLFEETIEKDIAYGPKNMGLDAAEIANRVKRAAEFTGLSEIILKKSPFEVSGGQRRRAAIAGIMAMEPKYLVLDEPAAGLDPRGRDDILTKIKAYQRARKSSVVIISHSMEDMAKYCDNIIVLSEGKLFKSGTRNEIFEDPQALRSIGLGVPQITKVMARLSEVYGITLDRPIYTVGAAVEEIGSLLGVKTDD